MKKVFWMRFTPLVLFAVLALTGCAGREPVTIRYAAWNLGSAQANTLERRMIASFNEKHPDIRVVIDESFSSNYDEAFKAASAGGVMPDLFMYASVPEACENGLCADITDITRRDGEWAGIPAALREAAAVKGKVVAIPSAMYFFGYFCNADLFDKKGAPVPAPGYSTDDFRAAAAVMTDVSGRSIGLAEESSIIDWYPAAAAARLGWYSWDGGKFNLDSQEFMDGVKLARSICANKQVFTVLSADEKKAFGAASDWEAWNAGCVAMKFDGTWSAGDYSKLGFKVTFAGLPGGRACIVPDFLFVSKDSAHPAEAYEFARFMSAYAREGFAERMKIGEANGLVVTTMPMVRDRGIVNSYFSKLGIAGIREVYDSLSQSSYVEGTKVLPGYSQARWNYATNIALGDRQNARIGDVLIDTYRGGTDIDAVAGLLNSAANECIQIFPRPADN